MDSPSKLFTLIELLIVITIIMILSTLVLTGYSKIIERNQMAGTKSTLKKVDLAFRTYYNEFGKYPVDGSCNLIGGESSVISTDNLKLLEKYEGVITKYGTTWAVLDGFLITNYEPYKSSMTYALNNGVTLGGNLYKAKGNVPTNTSPPNVNYWTNEGPFMASVGKPLQIVFPEDYEKTTQSSARKLRLVQGSTNVVDQYYQPEGFQISSAGPDGFFSSNIDNVYNFDLY